MSLNSYGSNGLGMSWKRGTDCAPVKVPPRSLTVSSQRGWLDLRQAEGKAVRQPQGVTDDAEGETAVIGRPVHNSSPPYWGVFCTSHNLRPFVIKMLKDTHGGTRRWWEGRWACCSPSG